jgi:para-nitrobenzyl esterase
MARIMSETWVRFAQTGDPNNAEIPQWRPYSADARSTMIFDLPPHVEDDLRADIRQLINEATPA